MLNREQLQQMLSKRRSQLSPEEQHHLEQMHIDNDSNVDWVGDNKYKKALDDAIMSRQNAQPIQSEIMSKGLPSYYSSTYYNRDQQNAINQKHFSKHDPTIGSELMTHGALKDLYSGSYSPGG